MNLQGRFISLEGIDGSGKTSLLQNIRQQLEACNYDVLAIREPGGTFISEKIRTMLLDAKNAGMLPRTEALLYAAARNQVVQEMIEPALARGQVVLADRYLDSTIAYQGFGRELDLQYLQQLNKLCTGGILPNLTLLLDIEAGQAAARRKKDIPDRLEKEGLYFQERVRQGYLELARREPQRIKVINAGLTLPEVEQQAWEIIKIDLGGL